MEQASCPFEDPFGVPPLPFGSAEQPLGCLRRFPPLVTSASNWTLGQPGDALGIGATIALPKGKGPPTTQVGGVCDQWIIYTYPLYLCIHACSSISCIASPVKISLAEEAAQTLYLSLLVRIFLRVRDVPARKELLRARDGQGPPT